MSYLTASPVKIMLVDDSAIVRRMIEGFFDQDSSIEVISSAENGVVALKELETKRPDLVILDVEMPEMDGLTVLPKILQTYPGIKVIMCSSLTERGAAISLKALSLGAIDCIAKPTSSGDASNKFSEFRDQVIRTVKGLFPDKINFFLEQTRKKEQTENDTVQMLRSRKPVENEPQKPIGRTPDQTRLNAPERQPLPTSENFSLNKNPLAYAGRPDIIAIGSSTGGPQALFEVLKNLKDISVPIVITQHMPPTFTTLLANHIQQNTGIPTSEGMDGMLVKSGHAYVAPGGFHMKIYRDPLKGAYIKLDNGPQVNYCKPSVDVMFDSLLDVYKNKMLGVILTGMGNDGLNSCKRLVEANGRIVAQDKETSTVWGMPRAVTLANICHEVLPLKEIGPWLRKQVTRL